MKHRAQGEVPVWDGKHDLRWTLLSSLPVADVEDAGGVVGAVLIKGTGGLAALEGLAVGEGVETGVAVGAFEDSAAVAVPRG